MNVWRDRLSRWFGPAAARCPLSPNAITLIALLLNMVAAACLWNAARHPRLFLAALALLALGGIADGFDGVVARVQQKQSRFGDFLDHACDRVSDLGIAAGWMWGNEVRFDLVLATLLGVMLNGYLGTQIEATWRERNYESVGRGEFVLAMAVFPSVSYILRTNAWQTVRMAGLTIAEWLTIALLLFAVIGIIQRIALAVRLEKTP